MKYLIYISTAVKLMDDADLGEILVESRTKNIALNVTGLLIYSGGTFIQVLEGTKDAVNTRYRKIEQDPRHKNVIKLAEDKLTKRNFPNWSMAFISVNSYVLEELEGYINPANPNFMKTDNTHAAITMLKTFADNSNVAV